MKLTKALCEWLVKNCDIQEDASDDEFKKAAGESLVSGTLSTKQFETLTKSEVSEEANQFASKLDRIADGLEKTISMLTQKEETKEVEEEKEVKETETKETKETKPPTKKAMSRMAKMFGNSGSVEDGEREVEVRVKEACEMYSDTKSTLIYPPTAKSGRPHPLAGQIVKDFGDQSGRTLNSPSERDMAVIGAWGKFMCNHARQKSRTIAWMQLRDHEKELILHAMENMPWCGATDGGMEADIINRKLSPVEQKGLIDDATSGGTEAVPIVFDDNIISTPILNGELFPLVNLVPLDKGRRIQGARAGTVTGSWGGVDDTAITLFDTTSYITSFDTTIYRWEGAIWIGLDFLSDTPIDFGQFLTQQYGEVLLKDMDDVVATGNGTTQPEGVMNKSGVSSVAFGGVAATLGGYESLRFGVHKREHLPNLAKTAVFCGTDVSYNRAMAIPVGTSDARRLQSTMNLGNYDGYNWMGRPYKINESLSNAEIFYCILGRYRMYRRRGMTVRSSQEGDTLIRRNELLISATARFGGQLERSACAAITTTAEA